MTTLVVRRQWWTAKADSSERLTAMSIWRWALAVGVSLRGWVARDDRLWGGGGGGRNVSTYHYRSCIGSEIKFRVGIKPNLERRTGL
ncbi:hypothetical protein RHGRI_013531 [Rhododendron griersonianum]|uniref:Secreted protein n=1 Tax=Rhododendron griersonianum TaxID=479676 RepID=A0AAV6K5Y2_9ERIC|nr:hypothetical protein RHGRI_013531 [Rhododendron griersonianum]